MNNRSNLTMNKKIKLNSSIDIIPIRSSNTEHRQQSGYFHQSNKNSSSNDLSKTEQALFSRVHSYLYENEDKVYIDVNSMADELRKKYREYRDQKRELFRHRVRKVYEDLAKTLSESSDNYDGAEDEGDNVKIERVMFNNVMNKSGNKKRNGGSREEEELIDISSDDEKKPEEKKVIDISSENSEATTAGEPARVMDTREGNEAVPREIRLVEERTVDTPNVTEQRTNNGVKTEEDEEPPVENNAEPIATTTQTQQPSPEKQQPSPEKRSKKRPRDSDGASLPAITKKRKEIPVVESTVKFADIGGCDKVLETICGLLIHIKHPEVFKQIGIAPLRGFLLHGPPGSGKTLLANAIAGELGIPMLKVAAPELIAGVSGESEERIRDLFNQATAVAPCVLFLDEIDSIAPNRATAQREMERRIVAQLLSCLDELSTKENGDQIVVLGATNRPDSLDPALRRAGRFDREVCLGIPDKEARHSILKVHTKQLALDADVNLLEIAELSPGFVGADLVSLLREAAIAAVHRVFENLRSSATATKSWTQEPEQQPTQSTQQEEETPDSSSTPPDENGTSTESGSSNEIQEEAGNKELPESSELMTTEANEEQQPAAPPPSKLAELMKWLHDDPPISDEILATVFIEKRDFQAAFQVVQPSAKREGFATVPDVTWDDIGSLQDIRQELQMAILAPVRYAENFAAFGLTSPTGVLLCGPPGCGKTLLAKAIANEAGINFISVKGPELLNMYVGESEKAVRQCFIRARNSAPCVIFFDELDALCPKRTDGDNSSTSRVVNQMLTEMDGVEGRKGVYLMAASNRPDIIDPAVLRPGRLDKILYVGLPTPTDRIDIIKALTKFGTKPKLASDVNIEEVANNPRCNGFTGADLSALIRESAIEALKETFSGFSGPAEVNLRHINVAFTKIRPSVQDKDIKHYEKLQKLYSVPVQPNPEDTPMEMLVENAEPTVEEMDMV